MRVLYVVGACLTKNTSANMSHNGYIQGLIENGCQVDIIMADDSWGETDVSLPMWKEANYYIYNSLSLTDKIKMKLKGINSPVSDKNAPMQQNKESLFSKATLRSVVKKLFYFLFPRDPIYPLNSIWLKNAIKFKSDIEYDVVISNSSPAASHTLVMRLIEKKHIHYKRWCQIWEDPWYYDIYGGFPEIVKKEEHMLLQAASEIYYVSPLTLKYQKQYFSDCAEKMKHIPLPAFEYEDSCCPQDDGLVRFGYFGDYYSKTRNLQNFYDSMISLNATGYIYGDSDINLQSSSNLIVHGRTTLDKLSTIQGKTDVLIHLCNLYGGQIPGKIYHYSMTEKPIIFILDGTDDEQEEIKQVFDKYNRYIFCENTFDSITKAIISMSNRENLMKFKPVNDFRPKNIIKNLL